MNNIAQAQAQPLPRSQLIRQANDRHVNALRGVKDQIEAAKVEQEDLFL